MKEEFEEIQVLDFEKKTKKPVKGTKKGKRSLI